MKFTFDFGNARGKWYNPTTKTCNDFMHAVAALSESEWSGIVGRGKPPRGILKVNGKAYAVGEAARRHIIKDRPKGASRYTASYYLPAAAFAMVEGFGESAPVTLYASHAPQDRKYVSDLIHAVKGTCTVECQYGTLTFEVKKVVAFDEPLCGYAHYVFNEDGSDKAANIVADKTVLLIDIGGYTADCVAVDAGGEIDLLSLKSSRVGTIDAIQKFEEELRARHRDAFKNAGDLDIRRVEAAIVSGQYRYGNQSLDCSRESMAAINDLVNDITVIINEMGGAVNYDLILLDGGGAALIYDSLVRAFPSIDFVTVDADHSLMKFANVFGASKLATLLNKVRAHG